MEIENSQLLVLDRLSVIDRISNLPCNILDNIVERLPIKDAVKTSILSKKWRYRWINLSKLIIDDLCGFRDGRFDKDYLVNFIYHVLFAHHGQIHTFKLSTAYALEFCHFNDWILFLMSNGIKELSLEFAMFRDALYRATYYTPPPCFFNYEPLTHLHLKNALLIPPDTFKGFKNLVSLDLQGCYVCPEVLTSLISNCPVLERLVLQLPHFNICNCFQIHAPKLKYLFLDGRLGVILQVNCPVLLDITFKMHSSELTSKRQEQKMICNLVQELGHQSTLKTFKFSGVFLEYLLGDVKTAYPASTSIYIKVPVLNEISISHRAELEGMLTSLHFFSSLQKLDIWLKDSREFSEESFKWLLQALSKVSWCFNLLRIVKIHIPLVNYNSHRYLELEIIKLVLAHSPILGKMTIVILGRSAITHMKEWMSCDTKLMKELMSFKRASAEAKIACYRL